jgi:hypothetical protein
VRNWATRQIIVIAAACNTFLRKREIFSRRASVMRATTTIMIITARSPDARSNRARLFPDNAGPAATARLSEILPTGATAATRAADVGEGAVPSRQGHCLFAAA